LFTFLETELEDKYPEEDGSMHFMNLICSQFNDHKFLTFNNSPRVCYNGRFTKPHNYVGHFPLSGKFDTHDVPEVRLQVTVIILTCICTYFYLRD